MQEEHGFFLLFARLDLYSGPFWRVRMEAGVAVREWVDRMERLCEPDRVVWCDGSEAEREALTRLALDTGVLLPLNPEKLPGCTLHRSHPSDVARTEQSTFICTPEQADAGPTNNWIAPVDAYETLRRLFTKSMRGRTMYVVPFLMGAPGSPLARVGVEITDSVYVVLSMRIMTRMGAPALRHLGTSDDFPRCMHSMGTLDPEHRYICHFPQDNEVWSINSGYGGNALLGKKCMALRIASALGNRQGWLAEHMMVVGIQEPAGRTTWLAGAFPSACGKTNLSMLVPPRDMYEAGWRVWTLGDDIAWLRPGEDGRLWAINPEAGFFGVAPGTSWKTNPNAMATIARDTIYTNVALQPDGTVWWEGCDEPAMPGTVDWQGKPWSPGSGTPAAHPNSRFTASATQCPSLSPKWQAPEGVPIDGILFGARRATTTPLVYQSRSWAHGVLMGAMLASETTAAATGKVGVLRHDPMAMLPFCGYNMGDYWAHWLATGQALSRPPAVFGVNWFRTDTNGRFLWPGFADNLRVLEWIVARCRGTGAAVDSAIGLLPGPDGIDRAEMRIGADVLEQLLTVDPEGWRAVIEDQEEYLQKFGSRVPPGIWEELQALGRRLSQQPVPTGRGPAFA
jgi:phosphoenolpyruvate carboxykinase (GTP)